MTVSDLSISVLFMITALSLGGIGPFNLITVAIATVVSISATVVLRWLVRRVFELDLVEVRIFGR